MSEDFIQDMDMREQEDTLKGKILTFDIDNQSYGVEIMHTIEIISMQSITAVPDIPDYIKGIINSRGKVIPVIDVGMRFNKGEKPHDERTCIVVVEVKDITVGLIVERIDEVITISDENMVPMPEFDSINANRFVKMIGKIDEQVKMVLDCEKLFYNDYELVVAAH